MKIGKRIATAREKAGFSQDRLASMIGVSRSACSQWERGHATPSVDNIAKLAQIFGVGFEWLATGRESIHRAGEVEEKGEEYESYIKLPIDGKEILERYYQLPDKKKKLILELMRLL
jgi:transcriptional regulator with XRE-family HTH domain